MSDMKLIMESWRTYSNKAKTAENFGTVLLFENKTVVEKDFKDLLKEYDSGNISAEYLANTWNESVLREVMMDFDPTGGAAAASHAKSGAKMLAKAAGWLDTKTIQLYQLAQRGIEGLVKGAAGIIDVAKKFQKNHPTVAKVAVVLVVGAAVFGLMMAFSSEASANIAAPETTGAAPGGIDVGPQGQISNGYYEALRGMIHQSKEISGTSLEIRAEAMQIVDWAQAQGETVNLADLQGKYAEFANSKLSTLNGLARLAKEGDPDAIQWIKELVATGKDVTYKVLGKATR